MRIKFAAFQAVYLRIIIFVLILSLLSFFIFRHYQQTQWKREIWIAMDTFFEIQVPPQYELPKLSTDIQEKISIINQTLNIYEPNSEIQSLNQNAAIAPFHVSEALWNMLNLSIQMSKQSQGLFDITFQPLQDVYGFQDGFLRVPSDNELENVLQQIGYQYIELNEPNKTVFFLKKELKINLSALIKGYVLDQTALYLEQQGIAYYILNFGGSIKLKCPEKMNVQVQHPRKKASAGSIKLLHGNISTSSDNQQFFEKDGMRYSHIINPLTGKAQNPFQSVTVQHPESALLADMISTTLILMDKETAYHFMQANYPEAGWLGITASETSVHQIKWQAP